MGINHIKTTHKKEIEKCYKSVKYQNIMIGFLLVLLGFASLSASILYMARKDDHFEQFESMVPSEELVTNLAVGAVLGKEVFLSEKELNSYLLYLFQREFENNMEGSDVLFQGVSIHFSNSVSNACFYLPITYHGIHFGVLANSSLDFCYSEECFKIKVNEIHIGKLPVPVSLFMPRFQERFAGKIQVEKDVISIPSVFEFQFMGNLVKLKVENFSLQEGGVSVKMGGVSEWIRRLMSHQISSFLKIRG